MEKKIEQWYELLPEPYRSEAMEARRKAEARHPSLYPKGETFISLQSAIEDGFAWGEDGGSFYKWDKLYKRVQDGEFDPEPQEAPRHDLTARIKELAAKYPEAKEALKELEPDAFKDDGPFEFGEEFNLCYDWEGGPICIGNGLAPKGIENRCLIVRQSYEMRTQEHEGYTILTFHEK